MERFVALRDRRLKGTVQVTPQLATFHVDATTSLFEAFQAIGHTAGRNRLKALFVLCHGMAGFDPRKQVSMDTGGRGLWLGRENLVHTNVSVESVRRPPYELAEVLRGSV